MEREAVKCIPLAVLYTLRAHTIKPVKNSSRKREWAPQFPPLAKDLLAVDGYWKRESHFRSVDTVRLPITQ